MNIFFRTDASINIGTGHVMRCLTLANLLREKGANVSFICRELSGDFCNYIESKGFIVYRLITKKNDVEKIEHITSHSHWLTVNWKTDAFETINILKLQTNIDWLVIDHYALEKHWESKMRPYVKKIMVIDDLEDREHNCDLLLDQNLSIEKVVRYEDLVPSYCKKFLGPNFTLLRKEFSKEKRGQRNGRIKRIIIFFGGNDFTNETKKAIEAFLLLNNSEIEVDIIVGKNNYFKEEIQRLCKENKSLTFQCQIENMAEIMSKADLAIGACGTAMWERCYLGLPAIVVSIADNQKKIAEILAKVNVIKYIGTNDQVKKEDITLALKYLVDNPSELAKMSQSSIKLMGEHEICLQRLIDELFKGEEKNN